jgi:hypothetical protein
VEMLVGSVNVVVGRVQRGGGVDVGDLEGRVGDGQRLIGKLRGVS